MLGVMLVALAFAVVAGTSVVVAGVRTRRARLRGAERWRRIEYARVRIEARAGAYRDGGMVSVTFGGPPRDVRRASLLATLGAIAAVPFAQLAVVSLLHAALLVAPVLLALFALDGAGAALLVGDAEAPRRARRALWGVLAVVPLVVVASLVSLARQGAHAPLPASWLLWAAPSWLAPIAAALHLYVVARRYRQALARADRRPDLL